MSVFDATAKAELGLMLTVEQVANVTALHHTTVRAAISAGDLTAYRVGRRLRVTVSDLERWLESKRVTACDPVAVETPRPGRQSDYRW
jgi:excisionase family DNA binding protein